MRKAMPSARKIWTFSTLWIARRRHTTSRSRWWIARNRLFPRPQNPFDKEHRFFDGTATTTYANKYFSTTTIPTKHIFTPGGELLATVEGSGATATTTFIHTDHLGGTAGVTDENSDTLELADYYPYGAARVSERYGVEGETFKYAQLRRDSDNLDYAQARYYANDRGQFLSQDPTFWDGQNLLNPQSLNSYSYAEGNPISRNDPLGLWANNGDGSFTAEKGDTLSKLQQETGRNWKDTGFIRDPRTLQIGEKVSFAPRGVSNGSPTINSTGAANSQYYFGGGVSVNLGPDIKSALLNSPEQKYRQDRIVTGKTPLDKGNYGVDLTGNYFFVGKTNVDYETTRGTKYGVTTFNGFVRDGYWDPFKKNGDGIGLKYEVGGTPYQFVPYTWVISYPTPK